MSDSEKQEKGNGADTEFARGRHQGKINLGISGEGEDGSEAKPPPKPGDADQSTKPEK